MRATGGSLRPLVVMVVAIFFVHRAQCRSRQITRINKWYKVACIPEHIKETDHYICDSHGYVHCLPGWTDEMHDCTTPVCVPPCSENGNCTRPNTCTCEVGWSGADCSKCVCLPGCVNGDCRLPFECICRHGWHGMLCNKPNCKEGCAHGSCSMPGECICHPGWIGENCDVCVTLPGCDAKHGYCDKPMQCNCKPGWTGNFCTEPICRVGCHRHYGWCDRPDDCWCKPGWTGPNCDQCMKYPGCQNGACEQPWECKCAPGWSGILCDVRELPQQATLDINPPPIPNDSLPQDFLRYAPSSTNATMTFGHEFSHRFVQGPAHQLVHTNKDGMQDAGGARTQGSVQRPRQPGSLPPPQGRMMDELMDVDLMEVDPMMHDIFDLFDAWSGGGGSMNAAAMAAQGLSQEQLESITSNAEQQLQLEQGPENVDMNSFFGNDAVPRYDRDIDIKQETSDLSQPVPEVSQAEEKQTDEHDEMNGDGSNLAPFGSDIAKE